MLNRYTDPKAALEAARSLSISESDLRVLAASPWNFVREAVAENPLTPLDTLEALQPAALLLENDFRIAKSLLRNPSSPRDLVANIARLEEKVILQFAPRNYDPKVMFEALASNPLADAEILGKIIVPHIALRI